MIKKKKYLRTSALLLRDSDFKGDATYDKVISLAKTSLDNDEKGYRREFIRLAETAEGLAKD